MAEAEIKQIDKSKFKENYNTNSSQIVFELKEPVSGDWSGVATSSWRATSLPEVASDVKCGGNHITVIYKKGTPIDDVGQRVQELIDQVNRSQNGAMAQIDRFNQKLASGGSEVGNG
jgi:hypothetical protein